jgi:hypothetical protein
MDQGRGNCGCVRSAQIALPACPACVRVGGASRLLSSVLACVGRERLVHAQCTGAMAAQVYLTRRARAFMQR